MTESNNRVPISSLVLWARRMFPYVVFFVGAVLGSAAVLRIFLPGSPLESLSSALPPHKLHELAWFGVSMLLYWLAFGMLERNARSWKLYQMVGAALTGALGIGIAIITVSDFVYWLTLKQPFSFETGTPLFTTGVALIVWSIALLANNGGACFLWHLAILPISVYTFVSWNTQIGAALQDIPGKGPNFPSVIYSACYFAVSMGIMLLLSQFANPRQQQKEKPGVKRPWQVPRSFPSVYHELLARGRFCELFEMSCGDACPLATSVVARYQKRRVQYRQYPDILEVGNILDDRLALPGHQRRAHHGEDGVLHTLYGNPALERTAAFNDESVHVRAFWLYFFTYMYCARSNRSKTPESFGLL